LLHTIRVILRCRLRTFDSFSRWLLSHRLLYLSQVVFGLLTPRRFLCHALRPQQKRE
jgi:hypothetical protein